MKNINEFKKERINLKVLKTFFGSKAYPTETKGAPCGDTFYDEDNDGKFSVGDIFCFNSCPEA